MFSIQKLSLGKQPPMYKVFVNNKPLLMSETEQMVEKNLLYKTHSVFEEAIHLLYSHLNSVNIYGNNKEILMSELKNYFKCVYAAGGIVRNNKNEILFIYRLGKWDLPKGKMELNESPAETALREVEEECGISDLVLGEQQPSTYHMYYDNEYILKITYWFEMFYKGTQTPKPQTEEAIEKAEWVSVNDLDKIFANTYSNVAELVNRYVLTKKL